MGHHLITIGTATGMAQIIAALVRDDRRGGRAELPSSNVRFVNDKKGQDKWMSPRELNLAGEGDCSSIVRAAAGFNGSFIGVVKVQGGYHCFILRMKDPITFMPKSARLKSGLTYANLYDPCVEHGMNNGKMPNISHYRDAVASRIWSPKMKPLPINAAAKAAAEATYKKGYIERHKPKTNAGRAVANVVARAAQRIGLAPRPPRATPTATPMQREALVNAVQSFASEGGTASTATDMVIAAQAPYAEAMASDTAAQADAIAQLVRFIPLLTDNVSRIAGYVQGAMQSNSPAADAFLTAADALAQYGIAPDMLAAQYGLPAGYGGGAVIDAYGNEDPASFVPGQGLYGVGPEDDADEDYQDVSAMEEADFGYN